MVRFPGLFLILFSISSLAWAVDFPIQMPKTTGGYLFDFSVNNQRGFSVNQNDASLTDLFSSKGKSELCGPTTVANLLANVAFANPNFKLNYNPLTEDYRQEIRDLAQLCKLDQENGTRVFNLHDCLSESLQAGGSASPEVTVIGPTALLTPEPDYHAVRPVQLLDIKGAIDQGYTVILEIKWDTYDPAKNVWTRTSGHYVLIVGYDYNTSFGDRQMILKVINPSVDYMTRPAVERYDNVTLYKVPQKPGLSVPPGTLYFLDGPGFKGTTARAFANYLILAKP